MTAEELIENVGIWAERDDRVIALALCGSHVRGEARPDSDIDICLVSVDPDSLLKDRSWLSEFGAVTVPGPVEDYGLVQSIRAFYSGLEVEFGIAGLKWVEPPIDSGTAIVMRGPLRVLYDPEDHFGRAIGDALANID